VDKEEAADSQKSGEVSHAHTHTRVCHFGAMTDGSVSQKSDSEISVLVDAKPKKKRQLRVCSKIIRSGSSHWWLHMIRRLQMERSQRRISFVGLLIHRWEHSKIFPPVQKRRIDQEIQGIYWSTFLDNANFTTLIPLIQALVVACGVRKQWWWANQK
jgi:hypothetical protein